jgi:hypothetical protein
VGNFVSAPRELGGLVYEARSLSDALSTTRRTKNIVPQGLLCLRSNRINWDQEKERFRRSAHHFSPPLKGQDSAVSPARREFVRIGADERRKQISEIVLELFPSC